jgi:hypothetical protein
MKPEVGRVSLKKIAGELLLYFYGIYRQDPSKLADTPISFQLRHFPPERKEIGPMLEHRESSILNIDKFEEYGDVDFYGSLKYLDECNLLAFSSGSDTAGEYFLNMRVTAHGVDLVEGIERSDTERNEFNLIFNFNVTNNVTVDSLLKAEFGSIFKASVV